MGWEANTEKTPLTPEHEAQLRAIAVERAPEDLAELESAAPGRDRFYALPEAAKAAYHLERFDLAAQLAAEALQSAPTYPDDWNYGNAIHAAHTVQGLLALRAKDKERAARELLLAGATKGSPQLNSFGPSMLLARDLLRTGEREAVLTYLDQCRKFWEMGGVWLDLWERKVRDDGIPNFAMCLYK
ncbi:hypothetical protein [Usitatibacter rugosus]|uniref:hypothetical protein n=1 Tax=Usitatibacter rugosus TaxID=2732067 RepID=UPI001489A15B|nr:hypothetical protein [Usitatibacter rugosus]